MATYGQLLIDAGGGVIDHGKQSARQDGATLVIGLGGTGSDAVMKLKKEVFKQLKPDDENAVLPTYSAIKYLVVDSDASKINAQVGKLTDIDRNTEFFEISNSNIKATFGATEILKNRPELYWLDYEHISINQASAGAGGIRQVGRFLLVDKARALYDKIKSEMQSALLVCNNGKLTVHICAGISGGTGSGTFLDVCYLVRQALQEIGKTEANVCGYFFLPGVNLSVPEVMAASLTSEYIKVNGYAALQELDYCMNFANNKDSFRMNYGFTKVDFNMQPVELCYLISTTDSSGNRVQNGYRYAMGVVTDHIISFLARVESQAGQNSEEDGGLTLEGHISNLNSIRAGITLQHGANVDYNILGASIAEMPLSEIATYLGAKLFENFRPMYDKTPTEKERDEFLVKNQLQYEDMRKYLTVNCPGAVSFPASYDAKMYKARGNGAFVDRAADFLASNKGEMEKNLRTMAEEITEFNIPKESTSLISRTYKALCDSFVTNLDFGPFYAKRMLFGGNNQNLIHAVDGYIAKNNENLAHELRQNQLRDDEYEQAKMRMDSAGILNEKKRMEEYLNALNNLYVHHYKIEQFKAMNELLEQYKKLLMKLDHNFFAVLTEMLETLRDTFAKNAEVLSEGIQEENTYTWKILSVKDIKEGLDEVVKNLDLNQTLYALMIDLFDNCKKWINQDENEISKLISDFILGQFQQATKKTMTDYLKEKFGVDNATLLEQKIEDEIIQKELWNKSTPLFWQNSMYNNPVGEQNTLTVPYDSSEICNAAKSFAEKKKITVRRSGIIDKMSVMRFYSGLPMYAYQGIQELERAYEADKKPGRHLYERGECNWNLLLPSPVPGSFKTGTPMERIENKNAELTAEFERAKELGIVGKDPIGNWDIQTTEDLDVEAVVNGITGNKDITAMTAAELSGAIEALKKKTEELQAQTRPLRIQTLKSVQGSEDLVMMDFYLMAPVLNEKVHKELEKRETLNQKIEEWAKMLGEKQSGTVQKTNFFNAIFTGAIAYGKKITFTYDEFGMEKVVELQNNTMPYGQAGAYQAYLTYETLDAAVKQKITALTMARMDEEESAEVRAAVDGLNAKMSQRIAGYLSFYAGDLKQKEIESFYQEFMKAFQDFKVMNDYL